MNNHNELIDLLRNFSFCSIGKAGEQLRESAASVIEHLQVRVADLESQLEEKPDIEKIQKLEWVATRAIRLLQPPYRRGGIVFPRDEVEHWEDLSEALIEAGYDWEEYT